MKVVHPPAAPLPERKPDPPAAASAPAAAGPSFRTVLADQRGPLPGRKPQAPAPAAPATPVAQTAEAPPSAPLPGVKPRAALLAAIDAPPPPGAKPAPASPLPGVKPEGTLLAALDAPPPPGAKPVPAAPLPGVKPHGALLAAVGAPPPPDAKPDAPPSPLAAAATTVADAAVPGTVLPGRKPGPAVQVAALPNAAPAVTPLPDRKPAAPAAPAVESAEARLTLASQQVAGLSGHSYAAILAQASQESGFDPQARSRTSSAAGPFQFLERTWLDLMRRHGAAYGLGELTRQIENRRGLPVVKDPEVRKQLLDLRHDIDLSAGMAARFLGEGRERLEARLKRPVTETESRIAYIMGVGGAAKLIRAAERTPQAPAADLLPAAARANKPLFYDRASGRALSAVETVSRLTHRMNTEQRAMFAAIDEAAQRIVLDGKPSPLGSFRMVRGDETPAGGSGSAVG